MAAAETSLLWARESTSGALELWSSSLADLNATVEYYKRTVSHWQAIQAAVRNHGQRGPVLQLTGPRDASGAQCRGIFIISEPGPATVIAWSIDVGNEHSALVQMHQRDHNGAETDYEDLLELARATSDQLIQQRD